MSETIYSHGEPWKFSVVSRPATYSFEPKHKKIVVKANNEPVQPSDCSRIIACVNFCAGIPTEFLEQEKSTVTSLICEWFRTKEDTVLCMLYDELTEVFDSIKKFTPYVSRRELEEFLETIVQSYDYDGLFKDGSRFQLKVRALQLLSNYCLTCNGTGSNPTGLTNLCPKCKGSGRRSEFKWIEKEEKT